MSFKSKNEEQWYMILGSVLVQGLIFILLSFFDNTLTFKSAILLPILMLLFYMPIWLVLKIDIISKIVSNKFVTWLVVLGWVVLMISGYSSNLGFIKVTLLGAWFAMVLVVPFEIAKIELAHGSSRSSSSPAASSSPSKATITKKTSPTPVPTVESEDFDEDFDVEPEDFYVECLNCGKIHTNPTNSLCSNCGKDMYKKDTNIKCKNCGSEHPSSEPSCPYCGT